MTKLERIAASRGQTLHDMLRALSASGKTLQLILDTLDEAT